MAAGPGCLSERELRAYVLGDLAEPDSLAASAHVQACPACEAAARRLDRASDPILDGLRLAFAATTLPDAPESGPPTIPWDEEEPCDHRGAAVASAPGGFEVLGEIGRGGSGVVYLARQEHPARLVALKMILDGAHGSPEQRSRILREADAIAGLRHPGIVQIHGVGRHGEIPFLTLEYVPGGNLAHRLGGAPMPPRDAAGLVEGVARAVDFAHRNGVVHRDLKPANVLLDEAGRPKVADFGLAKHGRADLTATGAILGTPSYIAPEQAAGGSRAARPGVDVYSLGAILYECLTGRPPFRAATALETIEQVRTQQPASPSLLQPGLPRDLVLVCLKCLRKEPDRRYASAGELADELRRFLDGAPLRHTRPVGSAERLSLWCRRNPAWAATIAGIAALLTTVAVGASIMSLRLDRALGQARVAEADSKVRLWESYLTQARAGRDSHRRGQRTGALAAIRSALELPVPTRHSLDELRTEAIAALVLPDVEDTLAWDLPDEDSRLYGVAVDAKLERYATVDRNGTVEIRRLADGLLLSRVAGTGPPVNPTLYFSPSGAYFVQRCGADARSRVWDLRGFEPALILDAPGGSRGTGRVETTPAFDPEEKHVALVHEDGTVKIHALDPARRNEGPRKVAEVSRRYSSMAFRPGRPHLALGSYEKTVRVVDARDGSLVASLPHPDRSTQVAWSPDGRTLATDCDDHLVRLWEVDSGTLAGPPLAGHRTGGTCPVFSGDGAYLFTNDWSASLKVWDLTSDSQILATPIGGWSFSVGGRHTFVDLPGGRLARMYRFIAPKELKTIGPTGRFAPRDRYRERAVRPGRPAPLPRVPRPALDRPSRRARRARDDPAADDGSRGVRSRGGLPHQRPAGPAPLADAGRGGWPGHPGRPSGGARSEGRSR